MTWQVHETEIEMRRDGDGAVFTDKVRTYGYALCEPAAYAAFEHARRSVVNAKPVRLIGTRLVVRGRLRMTA